MYILIRVCLLSPCPSPLRYVYRWVPMNLMLRKLTSHPRGSRNTVLLVSSCYTNGDMIGHLACADFTFSYLPCLWDAFLSSYKATQKEILQGRVAPFNVETLCLLQTLLNSNLKAEIFLDLQSKWTKISVSSTCRLYLHLLFHPDFWLCYAKLIHQRSSWLLTIQLWNLGPASEEHWGQKSKNHKDCYEQFNQVCIS